MKALEVSLFVLCTTTFCSCIKDKIYTPSTCCCSYVSQLVPSNRVVFYYKTNSACPTKGIVFLTQRGHHACANPSDAWVWQHNQDLGTNP
ncbi:C-C motif chemokine 3-like [Perognathus longimembris pacificus]|uniref:C-C motif chemokine 3-like n=1 Tax=Perognathus longimembris pacificus TaxID=214514 RepID=UPI00201929B6|nr:C-C motif chemokine 3-like [Perognathus longimembris pacificus]